MFPLPLSCSQNEQGSMVGELVFFLSTRSNAFVPVIARYKALEDDELLKHWLPLQPKTTQIYKTFCTKGIIKPTLWAMGKKLSSTTSDSGCSPINPCIDLHYNDSSIESHAQGHVIWSEHNQMEAKFDDFVALTNEFEEFMTQTYTCFRQEWSQSTTHNLRHGVLHYSSHR